MQTHGLSASEFKNLEVIQAFANNTGRINQRPQEFCLFQRVSYPIISGLLDRDILEVTGKNQFRIAPAVWKDLNSWYDSPEPTPEQTRRNFVVLYSQHTAQPTPKKEPPKDPLLRALQDLDRDPAGFWMVEDEREELCEKLGISRHDEFWDKLKFLRRTGQIAGFKSGWNGGVMIRLVGEPDPSQETVGFIPERQPSVINGKKRDRFIQGLLDHADAKKIVATSRSIIDTFGRTIAKLEDAMDEFDQIRALIRQNL